MLVQVQWCILGIPGLGRWRQEGQMFKVTFGYVKIWGKPEVQEILSQKSKKLKANQRETETERKLLTSSLILRSTQ